MSENRFRLDCDIVQDLLPLYQDQVCSEKSKIEVEEHLDQCEPCREVAKKLRNVIYDEELSQEKTSVLNRFAKKERRRSATIGIATASILMIPMIVSLICNLAIGHGLDWFFIVLLALILTASISVVPLMAQKNKVMWTMGSFVVSLTLMLGVICLYTAGDWFFIAVVPTFVGLSYLFVPYLVNKISLPKALRNHKAFLTLLWDTVGLYGIIVVCGLEVGNSSYWNVALPITTYSILLPWAILAIVRYLPVTAYIKGALVSMLAGVFSVFMNDVVDLALGKFTKVNLLKADYANWTMDSNNGNVAWIILVVMFLLAIVFTVIGIGKRKAE